MILLVAMAAVLVRLIYKMATDFRWFMTISTGMLILYIIGTMAIEIGLYYIVLAMKDIDDAREAMCAVEHPEQGSQACD